MNIIQFGAGRWGANHYRILTNLGHHVTQWDIESQWWKILEQSINTDAVIITTTSENHWPIAQMCLDMSIPVFVEKPILLKRTQLEELRKRFNRPYLMAGHQLLFMPEVGAIKGQCQYMTSMRNGAIPRSEGSLFSLMVHDVALAHYVTGEESFECIWAEGNKHEIMASLESRNGKVIELYAVSISNVRLRHTTFITNKGELVRITPDNWARPDLLDQELRMFIGYIKHEYPIEFNGVKCAYNVMSTVFKIMDKLDEKK